MNTAPTTYAIRVDGHLDDHWSAWLGELDMTRNSDGTTTITVPVTDQAQLHGVLTGLRDIGAVLIELSTTAAAAPILSGLERPLHTERRTLSPATADNADPTWKSRQLESARPRVLGRAASHRSASHDPPEDPGPSLRDDPPRRDPH